jgi:hypothetical protein
MNNNNTASGLNDILDWVLQDNEFDQSLFNSEFRPLPVDNSQVIPESNHKHNHSTASEDDELTDAQLKLLPSKERRQIRNKISARNFRNRRKGKNLS